VGLALALAASLLWGGSDFLGGTLSRRMRTFDVLALSQLVAVVLLGGYLVVAGGWSSPSLGLLWALAAGVAWTLGIGAFYSALATGTMGVVAPIAACGVAVPVLAGLVSGERPSVVQLLGIGLGVAGGIAAAGPDLRDGGALSDRARPVVLAVLTAVLFGVEILFLSKSDQGSVPLTLVGMRLSALICLGAGFAAIRWSVPRSARHAAPRTQFVPIVSLVALIPLGALDLVATAAYTEATRRGLVSLVAVLASLYPAVTVVLARQLHSERLRPVQSLGVAFACAGAVCIGLGGFGG
jgi:drug/metabolite transporter (DMT)-like permease